MELREDRRHIQERDLQMIKETVQIPINLEMAATAEMVAIAKKVQPTYACLVPEKRAELTTEGGLDVIAHEKQIRSICMELREFGVQVSLFIDPMAAQVEAAQRCGTSIVEINTGRYADAPNPYQQSKELEKIIQAVQFAHAKNLQVNAGHGLHYHNVQAIAAIAGITELNIGHAIVARAVFYGIAEAVREMKNIITRTRRTSCA